MTDHDDSKSGADAYAVAFKVGLVGSILLTLAALLGNTLAGLVALTIWSGITMFVLPWIYLWYNNLDVHIPRYLLRGPHQ